MKIIQYQFNIKHAKIVIEQLVYQILIIISVIKNNIYFQYQMIVKYPIMNGNVVNVIKYIKLNKH